MRYSVISKGLNISQLQDEVKRCGGRNLKVAAASKQIFCDLDDAGKDKLKAIPGLVVKDIQRVGTDQRVGVPEERVPAPVPVGQPIYGSGRAGMLATLFQARHSFSPPITGEGYNIAILDTGIRSSHRGLRDKVVYEANFTSSPTVEDVFNHGTAVAWVAVGGRDVEGEEQGLAPGARVMNIKVLDDDGSGTTESVVLGIEHVIKLREEHPGLDDPLRPGCINLSLGSEDTGDPDDPLRVACRALIDYGTGAVASCGNSGPNPGTITSPACDPLVIGIGSITPETFEVSSFSSRGPTKEGIIKPDVVYFGENLLLASCESDEAFVIKSGTSFSAPMGPAMLSLVRETAMKVFGITEMMGLEDWLAFAPTVSVKPEGAPAEKDNAYGFGLPYGNLIVEKMRPTYAAMIPDVSGILAIGLLGMMGASMAKALK